MHVPGCRSGWIDAPKTTAPEHEICPDDKAENSSGNEHFRYCTARWISRAGIELRRRLFGCRDLYGLGIPAITRILTLWSDSERAEKAQDKWRSKTRQSKTRRAKALHWSGMSTSTWATSSMCS